MEAKMEISEKRIWGIHTRDENLFLNENVIAIGWADENLSDETIKEMLSVMEKYNIDTKEKQCAFLAQVSFESGKGSKTLEDGDDAYLDNYSQYIGE